MLKDRLREIAMAILIGIGRLGASAAPVTNEQLWQLMEASRARYASLEAHIEMEAYVEPENAPDLLRQTAKKTIVLQMAPTKRYMICTSTLFPMPPANELKQTDRYLVTPGFVKRLREDHQTSMRSGWIEESQRPSLHFYTVYEALWGVCSVGWARLTSRMPTASVSEEDGLYIVEFRGYDGPQAPWLRLWIDPTKDYVPVRQELLFPDKSVMIREETSNWAHLGGVWIPLFYKTACPLDRSWSQYRVTSIRVNEPVAEDSLAFDFPPGTDVHDKIRGIDYVVGRRGAPAEPANATSSSTANRPALPASATDLQLAEAAKQAQSLIEGHAASSQQSVAPTVRPSYVWVVPGKTEYLLTVSRPEAGSPLSLNSYSFEPDGLVLHGVEDNIAEMGNLKVIVERPAEHTAFADAVLTLEFSGQSVPVHFVAAPLEP